MMPDEIECNLFYHLLQTKFRKKYESAVSKCCMLCIPCSSSLRGIDITEEFVDIHILKAVSYSRQKFANSLGESHYTYELVSSTLNLISSPIQFDGEYTIKILSVEKGYNKEYQQYKILITDKPLSPAFKPRPPEDDTIALEMKITCLSDVQKFLTQAFNCHSSLLPMLDKELHKLMSSPLLSTDLIGFREKLHNFISIQWMNLLKSHPLDHQRDARFQALLSVALENYAVYRLHNVLFPELCKAYKEEDAEVFTQLQKLARLGVTADQLGAPVDIAVPLPAAVVELASLDAQDSPVDKLNCLRSTLELMLAEVKGAIVDAHSVIAGDNQIPCLASDDTLPLLMTVIIQAKPLHLISNLFYMENFQWTLSPNDANSYCLVTFKAALRELMSLDPSCLHPRSEKVLREMGLEDLIKVTGEVDSSKFRKEKGLSGSISPLDRQRERTTAMIEASTNELRELCLSDKVL